MIMKKHQPKGGMCAVCVHKKEDCSHLSFKTMKPIKTYPDGTIIVKCTSFIKDIIPHDTERSSVV